MKEQMAIGFDRFNLDAAVAAVIQSAREKGQAAMPQPDERAVRLTEQEDVRTHLKKCAAHAYAEASSKPEVIQIAKIEAVPYSPVGFVFEANLGEMSPPPERHNGDDGAGDIKHLAYFWMVL